MNLHDTCDIKNLQLTEIFDDSLTLEQLLLVFLDQTGNLDDFIQAYEIHVTSTEEFYLNNGFYPTFWFNIQIDPELMFEIAGELGHLFSSEPDQFKLLLDHTLKDYLGFISDHKVNYNEDIHIWIELMSNRFPDPNFSFHSQNLRSISLQKMTGRLVSLSSAKKYEKSKLLKCVFQYCDYQQRVEHGKSTLLSCKLTGHSMKQVSRATIVEEYKQAEFLYKINRSTVSVRLSERCGFHLNLGSRYNLVMNYDLKLNCYSAWYITEAVPDLKPFLSELPLSIRNLKYELEEECAQSPWTFVSYMSAQLCSSIVPVGVLQNLKMGMLLSLASVNYQNSKPIPLFCLGPESTRILHEAALHLSPHCIDVTCNETTQGCVEGVFSDVEIQAGPLQLAQNGICYLGDWTKFERGKNSPALKVLKALEDGYISMSNQGKSKVYPLECSVWSTQYWDSNNNKNLKNQIESLKVIFDNFGLPFILDFTNEDEAIAMTNFLLSKSVCTEVEQVEESICKDDIKQFLNIVQNIQIEVEESSKEIIRNYFVATRRSRPDCSFPITSVTKLITLAESHARLRFSPVVTKEDAIAVISLYEQSINYVYGKNICTTICPEFILNFENPTQIHDNMIEFSLWIDNYLRTYFQGSSIISQTFDY